MPTYTDKNTAPSDILRKIDDQIDTLDPVLVGGDVLVTGFPGFVAKHLLKRLIVLQPDVTFYLLIQAHLSGVAEDSVAQLERELPEFEGRWELVEGDITAVRLGMEEAKHRELLAKTATVWHLAAIYDLAVPERVAYKVNVGGTMQILDFCQACAGLKRLNYISTCYVSGEREGTVYEDELDAGQRHQNHYETTKFWAEVEVRRRAADIPTVILRPGIIMGDSRTGETDKYDGPYFLMKLVQRMPEWLPLPNIGRGQARVNLIPIDFAADAMAFLGLKAGLDGETFHVADPNPMQARDVIASVLQAMGRAPAVATLPPNLVDAALRQPSLEKLAGVPHETLTYFNHSARYDTRKAQAALGGTDIHCPHLSSYMQTLVDYFLRNPEKSFLDRRRA